MSGVSGEEIARRCGEICRGGKKSECRFTRGAIGFIDTSAACDGTRGIAFFNDRLVVNIDGVSRSVAYADVRGVNIISSYEDDFADELDIIGKLRKVRISDYSVNKRELKNLLDELCRKSALSEKIPERILENVSEEISENIPEISRLDAEKAPEINEISENIKQEAVAAAPVITSEKPEEAPVVYDEKFEESFEDFLGEVFPEEGIPVISETPVFEEEEEADDYVPAPIPTEKIDWLSDDEKPSIDENYNFEESDERELISLMDHEQTMNFLAQAMSEINADEEEEAENEDPAPASQTPLFPEESESLSITEMAKALPAEEKKEASDALTVEPIWGDIYIKASRNLRELCESGRLSMEQIKAELHDRLLDSARAFAFITADAHKIPKVLVPRIAELKNAADNFDEYFSYGEDIAVRAMFFMLYQMLSYADRIAETPETKERLNDFFRRFGPAGILLSMLDMRV